MVKKILLIVSLLLNLIFIPLAGFEAVRLIQKQQWIDAALPVMEEAAQALYRCADRDQHHTIPDFSEAPKGDKQL